MSKQHSFTKFENEALRDFRNKLSNAESTEDIRNFFTRTTQSLFETVFDGEFDFEPEDIALAPDAVPHYVLGDTIWLIEEFNDTWQHSDLPRVVGRFADAAARRYKHLEKHPEKTDAKIRTR